MFPSEFFFASGSGFLPHPLLFRSRAYVIYESGCEGLDDSINMSEDGEIFPWSTLSAAASFLYGKNSNGYVSLSIYSEGSVWDKKPIGVIRESENGPGFQNTLGESYLHSYSLFFLQKEKRRRGF